MLAGCMGLRPLVVVVVLAGVSTKADFQFERCLPAHSHCPPRLGFPVQGFLAQARGLFLEGSLAAWTHS